MQRELTELTLVQVDLRAEILCSLSIHRWRLHAAGSGQVVSVAKASSQGCKDKIVSPSTHVVMVPEFDGRGGRHSRCKPAVTKAC